VGTVPLVANPIKYSGTPIAYGLAPPMLGEHTEEIQSLALELDRALEANRDCGGARAAHHQTDGLGD
jgi:crotonobetainyl-CoA:carnitine CoA-transferase CaiB-like acyl-CoA transferase